MSSSDQVTIMGHQDKEDFFLSWHQIMNGDSGGPVYAFRFGTPELVGISKFYAGGFGGSHKINHIKEVYDCYF